MKILNDTGPIWRGGLASGLKRVADGIENLPPMAVDDRATARAGETAIISVLDNDYDPEGLELTVVAATAANGTVVVELDGRLRYAARPGFTGTDTVTYLIEDAQGGQAQGLVLVDVTVNLPPVVGEDTATVVAGGTVSIPVLANDADPEGGALTLTQASAEAGQVVIEPGGTLTYTAPGSFSGIDTVSYTTVTYTASDPGGNAVEGRVTIEVRPLDIGITDSLAPGEASFAAAEGEGELVLTVTEPPAYAGEYRISAADLATGPVNLVPPQIAGTPAPGGALTVVPGLWAHDEAAGPVTFSRQWMRGDVPIDGADGNTRTVAAEDFVEGLRLVRSATNGAGTRSVEVVAIAAGTELPAAPEEPTPPAEPAFVETGVRFDRSGRLIRNADLSPADSRSLLYFVSFVPTSAGREGILRQTSIYNGIETFDGYAQFAVSVASANQFLRSRPLPAGSRVHILAGAMPTATGETALRLYTRFAGEAGWTLEEAATNAGPIDLTFGGFTVGRTARLDPDQPQPRRGGLPDRLLDLGRAFRGDRRRGRGGRRDPPRRGRHAQGSGDLARSLRPAAGRPLRTGLGLRDGRQPRHSRRLRQGGGYVHGRLSTAIRGWNESATAAIGR